MTTPLGESVVEGLDRNAAASVIPDFTAHLDVSVTGPFGTPSIVVTSIGTGESRQEAVADAIRKVAEEFLPVQEPRYVYPANTAQETGGRVQ